MGKAREVIHYSSLDNETVDWFSRKMGKKSKKTMLPNIMEIIKQVFLIVKLQNFPESLQHTLLKFAAL